MRTRRDPDPRKRSPARFGVFEFQPAEQRLVRDGARVDLSGKPLALLELLLMNAPALLRRDAIREQLWPDTVIEFDSAINASIRDIRRALGDDPRHPRYVETVPRHGYRFIAPVEWGARSAVTRTHRLMAAAVLGLAVGAIALSTIRDVPVPTGPMGTAQAAFVQGQHLLDRHEPSAAQEALSHLQRAVSVDPEYAEAWAALADAHYYSPQRPEVAMPAAEQATERALRLEPRLARAHRRQADLRFTWHRDFAAADQSFRRALELEPGDAQTLHSYAAFLLASGREQRAIQVMHKALAIDPLSLVLRGDLAWFYTVTGQHEHALRQCDLLRELEPENRRAIACPLNSLLATGRLDEAAELVTQLMPAEALSSTSAAPAARIRAYWAWRLSRLQAAAEAGRAVDPVALALAHARVGDPLRTLEWIDRGREARSRMYAYIWLFPEFRPLHDHPRFAANARPAR